MNVKICGITTSVDARMAAQAGADAIGINLFAGPRRIDPAAADTVLAACPPNVTPVLLIDVSMGGIPSAVRDVLTRHCVSSVQVYTGGGHGVPAETIIALRRAEYRPMVTVAVHPDTFPQAVSAMLDRCEGCPPASILLDTFDASRAGGTGQQADWTLIRTAREAGLMADWPPVVLAGGLRPENVAEAIALVQPWGVDVCSGVESSAGHKDPEQVRAFIMAAKGERR